MSFQEIRLNPLITYGTQTTTEYSTNVVAMPSGYEQRTGYWSKGRRTWNITKELLSRTDVFFLESFYRARAGRLYGFRMRDWSCYQKTNEPLPLTSGVTSQLQFVYPDSLNPETQIVLKPTLDTDIDTNPESNLYSPEITLMRNGVPFPTITTPQALVQSSINLPNYSASYPITYLFVDNSIGDTTTYISSPTGSIVYAFWAFDAVTPIDEVYWTFSTQPTSGGAATVYGSNDGVTWSTVVSTAGAPGSGFHSLNTTGLACSYQYYSLAVEGAIGDFRLYYMGTQYTAIPFTNWTIDKTTGIITYTVNQTGNDFTWTGTFDFPARFNSDKAVFHRSALDDFDWSSIEIIELKLGQT